MKENTTEQEIPISKAVVEVQDEINEKEKIVSQTITYVFDEDTGTVKEKKEPVYSKKTVVKKQIRNGVRLDPKTGKFYEKIPPTDAAAETAAEENKAKWRIPKWIKDKAAKL
jgi:hypothetical protein